MILSKRWTIESIFYLLALFLALAVRSSGLGAAPLSDSEAGWALQALAVARGSEVILGPQPYYTQLTGLLFFLFGASGFAARLLPALAGSLLVLLPLPFRPLFGRVPALILAFGLALDPGLVVASRMAGGPMPALAFGLLAAGAVVAGRPVLTGVLAGLALLSGPALYHGLLSFGLGWLAWHTLEKWRAARHIDPDPGDGWFSYPASSLRFSLTKLVMAFGLSVLAAGTLFMLSPQGIGALAGALPAYLAGWVATSEAGPVRLLVSLTVYEPLVLLFGIAGAVRAWTHQGPAFSFNRLLSVLALAALALALLYPARQVVDLAWMLAPLWGLAAFELGALLLRFPEGQSRWVSLVQAVFIFSLMAFTWINLANSASAQPAGLPTNTGNLVALGLGALTMALLTTLLVGLGWSWSTSRSGLAWGLLLGLGVLSLSGLWGGAILRQNQVAELWYPVPAPGQVRLLNKTLHDLSLWNYGQPYSLEMSVLASSPSLRWELREWTRANYTAGLSADSQPDIILAYQGQESPSLRASYRGQGFHWEQYPRWTGVLPDNWLRWLTFRDAPRLENQLILWARSDLFPGGSPGEGIGSPGFSTIHSQFSNNRTAHGADAEDPLR